MDLSEFHKCIPHDLLIAKLEVYGPAKMSLNIVFDYLNYRKQRTKIGCFFSFCCYVSTEIPQWSILRPLLFNIFFNDLFLLQIKSEICNFADDNTLYSCERELGTVILNLIYDMNILNWFRYNSLKANLDKFQFVILGPNYDQCFILNVNAIEIETQLNWNYLAKQSITNWNLMVTQINYAKQQDLNFIHYANSKDF